MLAATTAWWLVALGAVCILAAWFYTGGSSPYGYRGLGEVMVFVFFGLVAVVGTTYVQTAGAGRAVGAGRVALGDWLPASLLAAVGIGAIACAILVANNLRDIPTDAEVGKRTLAVVLGDARTRLWYVALAGPGRARRGRCRAGDLAVGPAGAGRRWCPARAPSPWSAAAPWAAPSCRCSS